MEHASGTSERRERIELEHLLLSPNRRQNEKEKEDEFPVEFLGCDGLKVNEAISIRRIANEIFRHISFADLLNCSLLNTTWNIAARYELREENRKCFAKIGSRKHCKSLNNFIAVVKKSWNLPFNGLSFSDTDYCGGSTSSETSESWPPRYGFDYPNTHVCVSIDFQPVLSAFKIKHLLLNWGNEPKLDCPAIKLIHHVVTTRSKDLVTLIVDDLPTYASNVSKYFGFLPSPKPEDVVVQNKDKESEESEDEISTIQVAPPKWLPDVRVLYLNDMRPSMGSQSDAIPILQDLMMAMPRLESLQGYISLEFLPTIFKLDKISSIHRFTLEDTDLVILNNSQNHVTGFEVYNHNDLLQFGLEFAKAKPKLRNLHISTSFSAVTRANQEAFHQLKSNVALIAGLMLTSSSAFLTNLRINHLDLVLLATHLPSLVDAPKSIRLTRLKHVTIELYKDIDERLGFSSICRVDLSTLIPRLESIRIHCQRSITGNDIHPYLTPSFSEHSVNYTCETVKKLSITGWFTGLNANIFFEDCSKFFPNVTSFEADMVKCSYFDKCCISLWSAWPQLESLCLYGVMDKVVNANKDPVFAGLEREACNRLLHTNWNFDAFKKLQVRPSLLNLTKLTGQCVLKQMPQLHVQIERCTCNVVADSKSTKCRFQLNHLKQFAKLVPGKDD